MINSENQHPYVKLRKVGGIMTKECDHAKVYSTSLYLVKPPQRAWICQRCGAEGTELLPGEDAGLYGDTKRKFAGLPMPDEDDY